MRLYEGTRAVVLGKAAPISSRWRPQNVAQNLVEGVIVVHLVTFIGFAAKVEAKAGLAAGLSLLNHATSKRQLIHKYPDKKLAPEANEASHTLPCNVARPPTLPQTRPGRPK